MSEKFNRQSTVDSICYTDFDYKAEVDWNVEDNNEPYNPETVTTSSSEGEYIQDTYGFIRNDIHGTQPITKTQEKTDSKTSQASLQKNLSKQKISRRSTTVHTQATKNPIASNLAPRYSAFNRANTKPSNFGAVKKIDDIVDENISSISSSSMTSPQLKPMHSEQAPKAKPIEKKGKSGDGDSKPNNKNIDKTIRESQLRVDITQSDKIIKKETGIPDKPINKSRFDLRRSVTLLGSPMMKSFKNLSRRMTQIYEEDACEHDQLTNEQKMAAKCIQQLQPDQILCDDTMSVGSNMDRFKKPNHIEDEDNSSRSDTGISEDLKQKKRTDKNEKKFRSTESKDPEIVRNRGVQGLDCLWHFRFDENQYENPKCTAPKGKKTFNIDTFDFLRSDSCYTDTEEHRVMPAKPLTLAQKSKLKMTQLLYKTGTALNLVCTWQVVVISIIIISAYIIKCLISRIEIL